MDSKSKSYFDELDDDLNVDQQENTFHKMLDELNTAVTKQSNFEKSVSVEAYHNRGFIKEGELIANYLKKGEQLNNIAQLVVDNVVPNQSGQVETTGVDTGYGSITMYGKEHNIGVYILRTETTPGAEAVEQQLIELISNYPIQETFNDKKVDIYVFAPFKDSEICNIIGDKYYEFRGCFELIHTMRGWVLLQYHKAILLPVSKDK
ncbi:MAG: hypothetical protein HDS44_00640 [Bacteroides sp.]|nr:hypothetical protein [Bacteroides sp.]